MRANYYTGLIIRFVLCYGMQLLLMKSYLWGVYLGMFPYILCLLWLPSSLSAHSLLLWGFVVGLGVDTLYHSWGIHAFGCVLMMYVRILLSGWLLNIGFQDSRLALGVRQLGWLWFFVYISILVVVHHISIFVLESGGLLHIFPRVILRIFYTLLFACMLEFIRSMFYKR